MRFFFRSRQFKIIAAIVAAVIVLTTTFGIIGRYMSPQASLVGAVVAPFQKVATSVGNFFKNADKRWNDGDKLATENDELKKEIDRLKGELVDYQTAVAENEFYKNYLEIKDLNSDFEFCPAMLISKDPDDIFKGFVIDSGANDGIKIYDPVITESGLVGYITEVGITTSKVTTILSPELVCGVYDSRTNDAGAVSGDRELSKNKMTKLYNLPRSCDVTVGDIIVTSGSGIFPDKIIIGTVGNIQSDPVSSSLYAGIIPAVDFDDIRNVMVITSFEGKGNTLIGKGE